MTNWKEKMERGYNIAGHNMRNSEGSKEAAEKVFEEGLIIADGKKSIRHTTVQLGDKYRNKRIKEDINRLLTEYVYSLTSEGYNILVMSPTTIKNSSGEELFLGDPYLGIKESDFATDGQEYKALSILDLACSQMGKIPPEFIYGYVNIHEGKIVENPNHYSHNQEKMDDLFDKIKSSLNSVQIEVSGALAKGDKTKIAYLKKLFETYAMTEMNEIIEKAEKEYLEKDVNIDQDEI
ncbi:MAG: hypothetical protein IKI57_06420 [Clostridia bacterium]|nr:hypothetical protein [Clostridia bacterium]